MRWIKDLARGDFQDSLVTRRNSLSAFGGRVPVTLQLGILAIVSGVIIGAPVRILSGAYQDPSVDYLARSIAIFALALPNFWLPLVVVVCSARLFGYALRAGTTPFIDDPVMNL